MIRVWIIDTLCAIHGRARRTAWHVAITLKEKDDIQHDSYRTPNRATLGSEMSHDAPWISFDDRQCMQCSHIFFLLRWMIPCSAGATLVFDWRGIPRSCWHRSSLWQNGGHPVPPRPLAGRAVKMQVVDWLFELLGDVQRKAAAVAMHQIDRKLQC